ncbi:MAG: hypothetical protein KIS92_26170 [Planctomycetota bacterium]|nr:hypothetical protein [Planctomycetota bacterium]
MFRIVCAMTAAMLGLCCRAGEAALPAQEPFKDDPAIVERLRALGDRSGAMLGKFKVEPAGVEKFHGALKNGPGRRDYGNKMAYAPDRGTALYCGANHGSPHRLNDVWEFHLASNTWRMICAPGTNATAFRELQNAERKLKDEIAKGADAEKAKAELEAVYAKMKTWYEGVEVKDGYLQDKANGGPVQPWHTWDGLTYDEKAKRLYWAELDSDNFKDEKNRVHRNLTRAYARVTGQDPEKLVAELKPGSSMYMYDPAQRRWFKQLGQEPFPIMRGMGGTLNYIPDLDKTIWYACVGNTPGGYDEGMWAYDAKTNTWENLVPGGTISGLMRQKKAPSEEIQAAYSGKHKKLVVVNKEMTFVFDFSSKTWIRVADNPGHGYDSHSVFAYDSQADVCLLLSKKGGAWAKTPWKIAAYNIAADTWEEVEIQGAPLPQDPPDRAWEAQQFAGYYDTALNVFVLYCGRSQTTYVYRHAVKK